MSSWTERLFARRTVEQLHAESRKSGLKRALGPIDLVLLGVGAIIGAGIFGTIGQAAGAAGAAGGPSLLLPAHPPRTPGPWFPRPASRGPLPGPAPPLP